MGRLWSLAAVGYAVLGTLPVALLTWMLGAFADYAYSGGLWFIGAPIRILMFILQLEFLAAALGVIVGTAFVGGGAFLSAARGVDPATERRISGLGILSLVLAPIAIEIGEVATALFYNWLYAGHDHGAGLISLGLFLMDAALGWLSVAALVAWIGVAPIALWKRRSIAK